MVSVVDLIESVVDSGATCQGTLADHPYWIVFIIGYLINIDFLNRGCPRGHIPLGFNPMMHTISWCRHLILYPLRLELSFLNDDSTRRLKVDLGPNLVKLWHEWWFWQRKCAGKTLSMLTHTTSTHASKVLEYL